MELMSPLLLLLGILPTSVAPPATGAGVVYAPCYVLGSVTLGKCDTLSPWNTYTWFHSAWAEHRGFNCYAGHGATTLPERYPFGVPSKNTTLEACKATCVVQPKCAGIVFSSVSTPPPAPPMPIPFDPTEQIVGPPDPTDPAGVAAWRRTLVEWRDTVKKNLSYTGAIYEVPALKWTQTSFIQPQMHPYDRYFFDPAADNYTVQRWLDDVNERYGGVDSILMWPTCVLGSCYCASRATTSWPWSAASEESRACASCRHEHRHR